MCVYVSHVLCDQRTRHVWKPRRWSNTFKCGHPCRGVCVIPSTMHFGHYWQHSIAVFVGSHMVATCPVVVWTSSSGQVSPTCWCIHPVAQECLCELQIAWLCFHSDWLRLVELRLIVHGSLGCRDIHGVIVLDLGLVPNEAGRRGFWRCVFARFQLLEGRAGHYYVRDVNSHSFG